MKKHNFHSSFSAAAVADDLGFTSRKKLMTAIEKKNETISNEMSMLLLKKEVTIIACNRSKTMSALSPG